MGGVLDNLFFNIINVVFFDEGFYFCNVINLVGIVFVWIFFDVMVVCLIGVLGFVVKILCYFFGSWFRKVLVF